MSSSNSLFNSSSRRQTPCSPRRFSCRQSVLFYLFYASYPIMKQISEEKEKSFTSSMRKGVGGGRSNASFLLLYLFSQPICKNDVNVILLLGVYIMHPKVCARIFEQSMEARNRVGIGLSYPPTSAGILEQSVGTELSYRSASLCSLAESIIWNRILGSFKVPK